MITGVVTALTGFILPRVWGDLYGGDCPVNGQQFWFIAMVSSSVVYVGISLLGKQSSCDMDKLLHRGKYSVEGECIDESETPARGLRAILSFGKDFSFGDKIVTLMITGWTVMWSVVFVVGTIYNLVRDVPDESWGRFWHFYIWIVLISGVCTTIWFTIGGCFDLRDMFRHLGSAKRDESDDGTVDEHLGDEMRE